MDDIVNTALTPFSIMSQLSRGNPRQSNTPSGKSFFGVTKTPPYSANKEDYFLPTAGRTITNSTLKTPPGNEAHNKVPPQGEIVNFSRVEASTACGGPVGAFGGKVCIKDSQACNIAKHSAKLKGDGTLGNDLTPPLVTGYYLQTVGTTTSVDSEPFLPTAWAVSSPVFQA